MRRESSTKLAAMVAVILQATLMGCHRAPYPVAPVAGKVTLDGQPVENAMIRFAPQSGLGGLVGPGSTGISDADGQFELKTHKGDRGAVVGRHNVSISTFEEKLVDPSNSDKMEVVSKERIPKKYWNQSELTYEVPAKGTGEAFFELVSQ